MSYRTVARLAWFLWTLSVVLIVLILLLPSADDSSMPLVQILAPLSVMTLPTVGALIASRRPENPIGWIFCAIGLLFILQAFTQGYAYYTLVTRPGALLGGLAMAWVASWVSTPAMGLLLFVLLLFPDGRLPSARWRLIAALVVGFVVLLIVVTALTPGPLRIPGTERFPVDNPMGIEPAASILAWGRRIALPLFAAIAIACAVAPIVRFWRTQNEKRQQLKWFIYAACCLPIFMVTATLGRVLLPTPIGAYISTVTFILAMAILPVATGVAVLRYRLYDIDVIINRTLVYGALTVVLVLIYLGGVVTLQSAFRTVTGQESQLAIVASTLAIAALFNPLRRRLQSFIDRRFYRRKYDARKTLEAFSTKLRDKTELETLNNELVGVVSETMQPVHVSLWLRSGTTSKEEVPG